MKTKKSQGYSRLSCKAQGYSRLSCKAQGYSRLSCKAQGHVEMMLSLVIFAGFLIFFFIVFNPFAKTETRLPIESIERAVIEQMSSTFGKLSVIMELGSDCYDFSGNYEGNYLEVREAERKYIIYFSDIFESNNAPHKAPACPEDDYTLGLYIEEDIIVYEKIEDLKESYDTDYTNLKNSIGISDDFSFSFKSMEGVEIPELSVSRQSPTGVGRESREFPVRVINKLGDVEELILNIRAW